MEEWEEEVDPFKVVGCERSEKVGGRKDVCNLLCCVEGDFPLGERENSGSAVRNSKQKKNSRGSSTRTLV